VAERLFWKDSAIYFCLHQMNCVKFPAKPIVQIGKARFLQQHLWRQPNVQSGVWSERNDKTAGVNTWEKRKCIGRLWTHIVITNFCRKISTRTSTRREDRYKKDGTTQRWKNIRSSGIGRLFYSDPYSKKQRKVHCLMTSMIELNALDRAEKAHNERDQYLKLHGG